MTGDLYVFGDRRYGAFSVPIHRRGGRVGGGARLCPGAFAAPRPVPEPESDAQYRRHLTLIFSQHGNTPRKIASIAAG